MRQHQADSPASRATPLRRLQQDLQNYMLGEAGAIEATVQAAVQAAIVDAPPLPVSARLGIYHNAYRVRLIEALDDTYPIVHAVLGDEVFGELGEGFIAGHPSVHRSIRWYGSELAQFLEAESPYADQPILAELAQLEWTLAEVFDSADAKPVQRAAFAAVDPSAWSELVFEFHPSLRRLLLQWNTTAVWQAMSRGETPSEPQRSEHPVPWMLWRQELQNYFRSMTADESAALDAALRGGTFGEICTALAEWLPDEEIPLRAASLLGVWADSGIIVSVS